MNINPYYGVVAGSGGGGSAAPHFAGFPFTHCPDAGFVGGGDFYGKHYHHHNGAVHHLVKHSAAASSSSVANGNNNNNAAVDAASNDDELYGRECNGKLSGYGDAIHAMHVGSPLPGYPAYGGHGEHAGTYRPGDDHAALTPSPHRPHQGLPPISQRGQWSPSSTVGASYVKGDGTTAPDPYKLSPETAHHAAPSTPASTATHGPSAAAFDAGEAVSAPMASPPLSSVTRQPHQPPSQCSVGHNQPIPYYPWMGVVGMYCYKCYLAVYMQLDRGHNH